MNESTLNLTLKGPMNNRERVLLAGNGEEKKNDNEFEIVSKLLVASSLANNKHFSS